MYAQTNIKHIRNTIRTKSVVFTAYSGANSFADGGAPYDGICEVCHTQTNHHQADGTAPGGQSHNDGFDCRGCHSHANGYRHSGGGTTPPAPHDTATCESCHTTPDTYVLNANIPDSACLTCHDTSAPGSNGTGWGDCRTENGTTSILTGTAGRSVTLTTPISDLTKAFLLVDSTGPQSTQQGMDHMVSGYISDANTLTFQRMGTTGQAEVSYTMVECFWKEFKVQRGEIILANGTASNTATITSAEPTRSVVFVNSRTDRAADEQQQAHVIGKLLNNTTVEISRASAATNAATYARYEVLEFDVDSHVKVITGETAFNGGYSKTVTLSSSVNMNSSWLYFTYDATNEGPQQTAVSGQLTAANRATFYRHEVMPYNNRIRYYVIEFPAGSVTVQRGSSSYTGGAGTAVTQDIPITAVSSINKAFSFVTNTTKDRGISGLVDTAGTYIEAENYTGTIPGTGTLTTTTRGGELNASASLLTGSGSTGNCDTVSSRAGREYMLNFPTAGTYNIWMRGYAAGTSNNTIFVGFYSGTQPDNGCIVALRESTYNTWVWTRNMQNGTGPGGVNPPSAKFTVPAPGVYPIRIWISETSHYLDGIFIDTIGGIPSDSSHGTTINPTLGTAKPYPRNRWTEVMTGPSNIRMSNWRGDTSGADTIFDWQVMEFTGAPGGGGGSDKKVQNHYGSKYIDPTTGLSVDIRCVECHNPMRSQSNLVFVRGSLRGRNVVFTSYSGANSFADGDTAYNGVCEVCHSQTNYHRYDGSQPVQNHNNGRDCRLCHQHINGYQQVVSAAWPHNTQVFNDNCTYCHIDNINYSTRVPNWKCEQCHTQGGVLKASFPTAQNVVTHSDATGSGKYTYSYDCVDCHEPMWPQANVKLIRETLAGSIVQGSNIEFTWFNGPGSFADGPPYNENVCDTCHSQTDHHQSDGTAPLGQSHNDGLDCAGCHPHTSSFLPSEDNCIFCHNQSPPFSSSDTRRRQIVEAIPDDGTGDFVRVSHHVRKDSNHNEVVTPEDCRVCHDQTNHQLYGDGVSVLLQDQDNPAVKYTFDGTGASVELFCLSCHDSNGSLINGSQPFINAGDPNSPINIGWIPGVAAHSTREMCYNCHGDATGGVNSHGSDNPFIHKFTFIPGQSQLFCYNCHDGSVATRNVKAAFDLPYSHRTGNEECKSCHDNHNSQTGLHKAGSTNLSDMIGGVNKGMGFNYQYEICFMCHNAAITKTNLNSEINMDSSFSGGGTLYQTYWQNIPNIQSQFATSNYAYHPLFAAGRNQPSNTLNANWNSSNYRKNDSATGGPFNGLDNNFVDGWRSTSLVTCSDCHGNGTASGARGIHGSDYPWLNKSMDKTVTVTTAGAGTITPNSTAGTQTYVISNTCTNCHRADVYGWGAKNYGPSINNENFSRISHRGGGMRNDCQATRIETSKGGKQKIGCANCHGGGEVAGIHGTNLGVGTSGSDALGKRFQNGNTKPGHTLGTTSATCYTSNTAPPLNQSLSTCGTQHGSGRSQSMNYNYTWQ